MNAVKAVLQRIWDFLADNDFDSIVEASRKLDWSQIAKSPYTWLIIVPFLIFLLWTKKYKIIIAIASFCLFILLIQKTLSHPGPTLALDDLLIFLAGAIALIGLNIYMFFVRE